MGSVAQEDANGAAVTSATEITEVQQTVVKEEDGTEVEVSHHRVFLLGENRWEDSSRLITNKKKGGDGRTGASTRCLTCRGEGRLLCTGTPSLSSDFLTVFNFTVTALNLTLLRMRGYIFL